MPTKAPPIDAETLAAFRYGVTLLEEHLPPDHSVTRLLRVRPTALAFMVLGERRLTVDARPLRELAGWLMAVAFAAEERPDGAKLHDECVTVASALVTDRAWPKVATAGAWRCDIFGGTRNPGASATTAASGDDPDAAFVGEWDELSGEEWRRGTTYDHRPRRSGAPSSSAPRGDTDPAFNRAFARILRRLADTLDEEAKGQ